MRGAGPTPFTNQRMVHDRDRAYARRVCGPSMVAIPRWDGDIAYKRGKFLKAKAPILRPVEHVGRWCPSGEAFQQGYSE